MKKNISLILFSVIAAMGCLFTSCNDNDTTLSRAVLASVNVLEYEVYPTGPQIITVTSDGDWVVDAPEWVMVTPSKGSVGQTEVEILVMDNERDQAPDNPRRGDVKFKGRDLESIATVIVRQDGDKFRDPEDYSIDDMEAATEETVVRLPGMICVVTSTKGMIVTDGEQYAYVQEPAVAPVVGNKYDIVGEKKFDSNRFSYVLGERMTDHGASTVPAKTPFDITETLDNTNGKKYQYVTVAGNLEGTTLKVPGATNDVALIDAAPEANVSALDGHKVVVTGYFAGLATPFVNIIPVSLEDKGLNEVIYFADDFEWLAPWAQTGQVGKGPAGDQFGKFDSNEQCPQLQNVLYDGVSAYDAVLAKGYNLIYCGSEKVTAGSTSGSPKDCTYLQANYLKFGKTGYYAGLVLPPLKDVEEGVDLLMTFDWGPMMSGKGNWDKTLLVVVVENDGKEEKFLIPEAPLTNKVAGEWQKATVDLAGVKVNANTKITIRNIDDHWPLDSKDYGTTGLVRYFIDNIKIKAQ